MLGADAHGKQEVDLEAIERCRLFCDEWEQASAGGELANAVEAGLAKRDDVTQLGDVLTGAARPRSDDEITLFDSTGLAIQDLAICREVYERWQRRGRRSGRHPLIDRCKRRRAFHEGAARHHLSPPKP